MLARLASLWRNLRHRDRVERDLDDEMRFHLAARTQELIDQGMAPEKAQQQASQKFGNALLLRESSRDIKLLPWLESMLQDVGFGLRL